MSRALFIVLKEEFLLIINGGYSITIGSYYILSSMFMLMILWLSECYSFSFASSIILLSFSKETSLSSILSSSFYGVAGIIYYSLF